MVAMILRVCVLGALALGAAFAGACNDNDNGDPSGGTPPPGNGAVATMPPGNGEPEGTPTLSAEQATAIAAGAAVEMDEWADPNGRYVVDFPRGWEISPEPANEIVTASFPHYHVAGVIGIQCSPGLSADEMFAEDRELLRMVTMQDVPMAAAVEVEVAGTTGFQTSWSAPVGIAHLERTWTYFEGGGCAWRISWTEDPDRPHGNLKPIYDRVLETFTLLEQA